MTILGHLFPDQPWVSMWDWNQKYGPRGAAADSHSAGYWFGGWHEPVSHSQGLSNRERQNNSYMYQEPSYSDYCDEWSDSDDFDMNTNSDNRPTRKRHCCQTRSKNCFRSIDLTDQEIDLTDQENEHPVTRSVQSRRSSGRISEGENVEKHTRYRTRTSENKLKKPDYVLCDSDIENDINDTSNYSVYEYLKAFLNSTGRQIDSMRGDGNCFFRALSKVIYGNQTFYDDIRQAVVDVLEEHPKKFEAFADGPVSQHIKDMREDKTWATQTEIYAAATLLNRDIYILSPDQTGDTYRWLLFKPQFKYNSNVAGCRCYITICHTHGNHYDRIAARNAKCNCDHEPPEMSGFKESVDLTGEDEIV